jgi:hypothetical protein
LFFNSLTYYHQNNKKHVEFYALITHFSNLILQYYEKVTFFLALITTITLFSSCNKIDKDLGTPDCLNSKISEHAAVQVWKWESSQEIFYLFNLGCCDQFDLLYDEECNLVCAPSGGFSGDGDGSCSESLMMTEFEKTLIFDKD